MRIPTLTFLLAGLAFSQITPDQADTMQFYSVTYQATLSGSPMVFTLQSPGKAGRRVYPQVASIECSAACTVTQDRNGSAATGTIVTAVPLNTDASPVAAFYRSSDAGAGSALNPVSLASAGPIHLDMKFSVFSRGLSNVQNHNWRVTSAAGTTVRVSLFWGEK